MIHNFKVIFIALNQFYSRIFKTELEEMEKQV